MKTEETTSHLTKALRKSFSEKKKNSDKMFESEGHHSKPYKKPKTNFKHYIEEQLAEDDYFDHDDAHLYNGDWK